VIHSQDLDQRKDVEATIADYGNGTYRASYMATVSGRYQTIVTLNGVAINGSCPSSCLAVLPPSTGTNLNPNPNPNLQTLHPTP